MELIILWGLSVVHVMMLLIKMKETAKLSRRYSFVGI